MIGICGDHGSFILYSPSEGTFHSALNSFVTSKTAERTTKMSISGTPTLVPTLMIVPPQLMVPPLRTYVPVCWAQRPLDLTASHRVQPCKH